MIFPEATDGECGLLAVVGLEFARLGPEGEVYNSFFGSLEVIWGGKVMAEEQVKRIFEEVKRLRSQAVKVPLKSIDAGFPSTHPEAVAIKDGDRDCVDGARDG
jgi:hypothetical protein